MFLVVIETEFCIQLAIRLVFLLKQLTNFRLFFSFFYYYKHKISIINAIFVYVYRFQLISHLLYLKRINLFIMFWTTDLKTTRRSQSYDNRSMSFRQNANSYEQNIQVPEIKKRNIDKNLSQKVDKFMAVNKKHQFDQVCVCEDCIYQKQFQRYNILKMDLSKNSSYRAQYNKQLLKRNFSNTVDLTSSTVSSKIEQGNILKNPYVQIDSMYNSQFASRSLQKVQKQKPKDQIKFAGPLQNYSSYKQQYIGVNSPSQYLQPVKEQLLPSRRFKSGSIYTDSFKGTKIVQTESAKMKDQLTLGKPNLVVQSTNKKQFNIPNPQQYSTNDRYLMGQQKRIQTPNFSFQYKTINREQYQKPAVQKKHCRNKRMQVLHGHMLTSNDLSTIS